MPMAATWVTIAPPRRSVMGPAKMRDSEPTKGPKKAYFRGSGAPSNFP